MNENGIGPEGAEAFAQALEGGSLLRVLRLRGNAVGDEGASALGRALATMPALEELDVGNSQVRSLHRAPNLLLACKPKIFKR